VATNHINQRDPSDLARLRIVSVNQTELQADLHTPPQSLRAVAGALASEQSVCLTLLLDEPGLDLRDALRGEGELWQGHLNGAYRHAVLATRPRIDPAGDARYQYL
jgi:hypothetical protein